MFKKEKSVLIRHTVASLAASACACRLPPTHGIDLRFVNRLATTVRFQRDSDDREFQRLAQVTWLFQNTLHRHSSRHSSRPLSKNQRNSKSMLYVGRCLSRAHAPELQRLRALLLEACVVSRRSLCVVNWKRTHTHTRRGAAWSVASPHRRRRRTSIPPTIPQTSALRLSLSRSCAQDGLGGGN